MICYYNNQKIPQPKILSKFLIVKNKQRLYTVYLFIVPYKVKG